LETQKIVEINSEINELKNRVNLFENPEENSGNLSDL